MAKRTTYILPYPSPTFILTKAANQSIPNIAVTKVTLDSVLLNTGSYLFRSATNDVVIGVNGWYQISYVTQWAAGIVGNRSVQIFRNGAILTSDAHPVASIAAALPHKFSSAVMRLLAGDFIDMRVYHNQGAALVLNAIINTCPMLSIVFLDNA